MPQPSISPLSSNTRHYCLSTYAYTCARVQMAFVRWLNRTNRRWSRVSTLKISSFGTPTFDVVTRSYSTLSRERCVCLKLIVYMYVRIQPGCCFVYLRVLFTVHVLSATAHYDACNIMSLHVLVLYNIFSLL